MKLHGRLLLGIAAVTAVAAAAIGITVTSIVHRALLVESRDNAVARVSDLAARMAAGARARNEKSLLPLLQTVQARAGAAYAVVVGKDGRVLAHTNVVETGKTYRDAATVKALAAAAPSGLELKGGTEPLLDISIPVMEPEDDFLLAGAPGSRSSRIAVLRFGIPLRHARDAERRILTTTGLVMGLVALLGLIAAHVCTRVILAPVDRLTEGTRRIAGGELGLRLPVTTKDELGDLTSSFNTMSSSLATEQERRRAAEESREASRKYFRQLVENVQDIIAVINPDATLRYGSPALTTVFGFPPEERLGRNVFSQVHPDDLPRVQSAFAAGLSKPGEVQVSEFRYQHRDGRWVDVEAIGRSLLDDPVVRGVVVVFRDVTSRKRAERELADTRNRLALAQKMDAIGRLASQITHDFNNILGLIEGYASHTLRRNRLEPPVKQAMEEILLATERGAGITRRLLQFSRGGGAHQRVLDLSVSVREHEELLKTAVGGRHRLVLDLAPGAAPVRMDPADVTQILLNLAVNARDAMSEPGTFTVRTVKPEGAGRIMLEVADTGMGMDPATCGRVFEPFFTTKAESRGTGLGLATVYGIVTGGGGTAAVESAPGRGARFVFDLPLATEPVAAGTPGPVEAAGPETAAAGNERDRFALIVDDDPAYRGLVSRILREAGWNVLSAGGGPEALAVAAGHSGTIDIMVTDVRMGGMDGFELARRIRAARPVLSVLFISGDPGPRKEPGDAGPMLSKPFTDDALLRAVKEVCDGNRGA